MHSEEPSPFTPPIAGRIPVVWLTAALVLAGFGIYHGSGGWPVEPAVAPVTTPRELPEAGSDQRSVPTGVRPGSAISSAAALPQWVRCEANGRVTYNDGGCAGAIQKSSSVTTQAALSTVPTSSNTAGTTTIYRCTAYNGAVFWSSAHCNQKQALIDHMVSVPRGLGFQQQIALAERSMPSGPPVRRRAHRRTQEIGEGNAKC